MRIQQRLNLLAIVGATLLSGHVLAIDPPPRVGATRDASRSEPPQPQPSKEAPAQTQEAATSAQADPKPDLKPNVKPDPKPDPEPATDAKGKRVKPTDPPNTGKKPFKRRAVWAQRDEDRPSYGPILATPAPATARREPMPQSHIPLGPVILNGCTGGHCNDQGGQRYNAVGTTLVSPQGRLCSNNGISVSCY